MDPEQHLDCPCCTQCVFDNFVCVFHGSLVSTVLACHFILGMGVDGECVLVCACAVDRVGRVFGGACRSYRVSHKNDADTKNGAKETVVSITHIYASIFLVRARVYLLTTMWG